MTQLFSAGDKVEVSASNPPGHRRTPYYIRGKTGIIERSCGTFLNPEELGYGFSGLPKKNLYRVRFRQQEIWPDYTGSAQDTVDIDLYEHWLTHAKDQVDR